ncbi:S1 family peptidase [Actinokineospora globicatena]|uniref:Trypsin n=1 Tax=Actinokineospora globicatena TaxID=103729 RepID=A0A9W6QVB0_9PSEU|nr:trypsin-like serine protease [Actinokineospora globicatena]MCP2306414.1 Trypsin [Actinokineospora globicatena]GLW81839.1 trypsin [Actinokineospora globicatena]GLW88633.1 trypsin [Actinokineospora globicatena]GLW95264.1 trypsin [Actinokineospora globicatena]
MKKTKLAVAIAGAALAVLAAAPTSSAAPSAPAGDPVLTPAIIGGGTASNAPWAARLFSNGQQSCSATIIAPQYILTAKHCVASGTISFRVGSLDQTTGGTTANASQIYRHSASDLAIARLDRSVSATYAPLGTTADARVGQQVQVYGWGATCTGQPEINCQSRYLKVATVQVTSTNARDAYNGVAVQARRVNGITAGGDSGGPMFGNGRQIGVASTSDRQSITNYTSVGSYRSWIQSIAGV